MMFGVSEMNPDRRINGIFLLLLVSTLLFMNLAIKPVKGQTQNWQKYVTNPVLIPSGNPWEAYAVSEPAALTWGLDIKYHLYYRARASASSPSTIAYAYSTDRVTFTKGALNPVLVPGPSWESQGLYSPTVLRNPSGEYLMWYGGYDGYYMRIGLATSPTAAGSWQKYPSAVSVPVLDISLSSWESKGVYNPTVLWDERARIYRMWYAGFSGYSKSIGYATSADGRTWQKYVSNPILQPGSTGAWDSWSVDNPTVIKIGGVFWMWYTGEDAAHVLKIGCAYSIDGKSWTKWSGNPLLGSGPTGTWDSSGVLAPTVFAWDSSDLIFGGALWLGMYYSNGALDKIGHATVGFGVANLPLLMDSSAWQVFFINGDPSRSQYTAYDSLSAGILYGLCYNPQNQGFDTNPNWVVQSGADKGKPLLLGKSVVTMGGPNANWIVKYYEVTLATTPAYFRANPAANAYEFVDRATGSVKAYLPMSTDFNHKDLVVVMIVPGLAGFFNDVIIMYGINWRGTWGAGIYFKDLIWGTGAWSNPYQFVGYNYVILYWEDSNNDAIPDGAEITLAAGG